MRPSVNNKILIGFVLLVFMAASACKSSSQSQNEIKTNTDKGIDSLLWVNGIDDPNVNYYKMLESFEAYWDGKIKPTDNHGEAKNIYKDEDSPENSRKDGVNKNDYVYEYKRFLNWKQRTMNLVKPDGSIMSTEEIYNNWQQQKDTL